MTARLRQYRFIKANNSFLEDIAYFIISIASCRRTKDSAYKPSRSRGKIFDSFWPYEDILKASVTDAGNIIEFPKRLVTLV